ncbi:MAG: hypothetical protein J1F03_00055 [Oscillospiraceae bacterium]|nr:hypothetical protein [Oscillospiraceae bacterium]
MPKLKLSPVAKAAEIVQRNIESRGALFGLRTERDFSERLNMPKSTYHAKRTKPRTWTVAELAMVACVLKVTLSWLMIDHSGEITE